MDTKIEIKEEDPLSDDAASRNEGQFLLKDYGVNTTNDAVLLDNNWDVAVKTEIKSETPFADFCVQKETDSFTNDIEKQNKTDTDKCHNVEIGTKTEIERTLVSEFGSRNEREFLPQNSVIKVEKYNSDNEVEKKVEIKQEVCWLKTETSSFCDNINDEDFCSVKSSGLCKEAASADSSGKLPLASTEGMRNDASFYTGKNYEDEHSINFMCQTSYVTEMYTVGKNIHSERTSKCNDGGNTRIMASNFKQKHLIQEGKEAYKCEICEKRFTALSSLKRHNLIHAGKKPHKCEVCEKRFIRLSDLKNHNLIHEGIKSHKCEVCEKRFARLSDLKTHKLIHEGKKPHQCIVCKKRFNVLSNLKRHNLIHEGKEPYKCEICERKFTSLSNLKRHNLIHEGKKPHKCEICEKRFTRLSDLKSHNLNHEGTDSYKCEICEKKFIWLSHLQRHNSIHEGKKSHQCEICAKSFTRFSYLKTHNLIHEGKKPHKCQICEKSFTQLSNLKSHKLIHEGKKKL